MRSKLLAVILVLSLAGGAFAAVVVEKKSRQVPDTAVLDCQGIHAFVFRGPTGTSRRPILVPLPEYWTAPEAGLYKFILRYQSGHVCSRMVTPEVFARYRVGDDFRDDVSATSDFSSSDDSKTIQPIRHHRHRTAQLRNRSPKQIHRMAAQHQRKHKSLQVVAQR